MNTFHPTVTSAAATHLPRDNVVDEVVQDMEAPSSSSSSSSSTRHSSGLDDIDSSSLQQHHHFDETYVKKRVRARILQTILVCTLLAVAALLGVVFQSRSRTPTADMELAAFEQGKTIEAAGKDLTDFEVEYNLLNDEEGQHLGNNTGSSHGHSSIHVQHGQR